MTTKTERYVGIDVSKDRLDLAVLEEKRLEQHTNTTGGVKRLVDAMKELMPALIVVEVTGGYERAVVQALFEAGLPVARVSGYRARQYARAKGQLAKTDPLDAMNLAEYGKHVQPRIYEAKSEQGQCLAGKISASQAVGRDDKGRKEPFANNSSEFAGFRGANHRLFAGGEEGSGRTYPSVSGGAGGVANPKRNSGECAWRGDGDISDIVGRLT